MKPTSTLPTKRRKGSISSDDEIDISSALTGKRVKFGQKQIADDEDENSEDLESLIREATKKRDIKDGTKLLKKTKARSKIVKGELGGGSFQSMGKLS